ncbi:MAG: DNA-binding protein [Prevotella sp.]|nr:DNA-binding protein [Prevotella sp.]
MALNINLYQDRRSESDNYGKVYGRVKNSTPIGIADLAKHMAEHGTPFSKGTIQGILSDMSSCVKELMLMGQPVKLDDLGIFYATVESTCANTAADFDLSKNIKAVKLLCRATGDVTRKELTSKAQLQYSDLAQKVRDGKVDIATLYDEQSGGGSSSSGDDDINPQRP